MMSEKDTVSNQGFKIEDFIALPLELTGEEIEEMISRLQLEIEEEKEALALLEKQLH